MATFDPNSVLEEALQSEVGLGERISPRKQGRALEELFDLFTRERSRVHALRYLDIPRLRDAYLRYHLPLNFARARIALEQVRRVAPDIDSLEDVVDLGAGPGSATLATFFALPRRGVRRYHLFDRSRAALDVARRLLGRCAASRTAASQAAVSQAEAASDESAARDEWHTTTVNLPRLPRFPSRSLVWLAMVLNELEVGTRKGPRPDEFLTQLARRLEAPSTLILVEPALRHPSRNLLRLHDAAVESGRWRVLAPCTHQQLCPLLSARGASWCHFRFPWQPPKGAKEAAEFLGVSWQMPSLSFLALRREDSPRKVTSARARVIGDPMALKEGRGVYVCRDGKRRLVPLPQERIIRGDIVRISKGEVQRIETRWRP